MRHAVLAGSGTSGLATLRNRFGDRFLATKRARSAGERGVRTFALHGIDVGGLRAQWRRAAWTRRRKFRLLVEAEEVADHREAFYVGRFTFGALSGARGLSFRRRT